MTPIISGFISATLALNSSILFARLSAFNSIHLSSANVKNTGASTFAVKNHRNHYKTPYFMLLVSIKCGGKPLKTTNKLAGPVGKKGVLGGVYRLRNE